MELIIEALIRIYYKVVNEIVGYYYRLGVPSEDNLSTVIEFY